MCRSLHSLAAVGLLASLVTLGAQAQEAANPDVLFRQLQSPGKTDSAAHEFVKLKANVAVRDYLRSHVALMIREGPHPCRQCWDNAADLAGKFRIAEAVPALAAWIGSGRGSGTLTFAEEARLANDPAGKALAEIGDPSVVALARVLARGNLNQRWNAFHALNLIGSPRARQALQNHMKEEPDPSLRKLIGQTLNG